MPVLTPERIEWRRHYRRVRLERRVSRLPYYRLAALGLLVLTIAVMFAGFAIAGRGAQ